MSSAGDKGERLKVGTILDERFEIERFLGAGSFGEVYQAKQLVFGHVFRRVALKLFKKDAITEDNVVEILNDAILIIRLLEENPPLDVERRFVKVFDIGILDGPEQRAFMTMQLVPGRRTLDHKVRENREEGMPVDLCLWYLSRVLVPLAWMHEQGVVHGDIKPDNILLREDAEIVLTDFGLAARLTLGVMGGAIQYQAPEVLRGMTGETQADVYAIGVMWYEMLTGQNPFRFIGLDELEEDDQKGFVEAHVQARKWPIKVAETDLSSEEEKRIQPASEINPDLLNHPQVEALLNRCLAYKVSERFHNAGMLLKEIQKYKEEGQVSGWVVENLKTETDEEKSTKAQNKTPDAQIKDAMALLNQNKIDQALQIIKSVLASNSSYVPAILAEAGVYITQGDVAQAGQRIKDAMNISPNDPAVFDTLAQMYQSSGKTDLAYQMQKKADKFRKR